MEYTEWICCVFTLLGLFSSGETQVAREHPILDGLDSGFVTRDTDNTMFTWDPSIEFEGRAWCEIDHDANEGHFYIIPNVFFLAWLKGLYPDGTPRLVDDRPTQADIMFTIKKKGTEEIVMREELFDIFLNDATHSVTVNMSGAQYLEVISDFDLSGFLVGQDISILTEVGAIGHGPIADMTMLQVLCGNNGSATGTHIRGTGITSVTSNFAEYVLGHTFWREGMTYFIPPFPDAQRGYYLKITGLLYDVPDFLNMTNLNQLAGVADGTCTVNIHTGPEVQTVTVVSVLQVETVLIQSNEGSWVESACQIFMVAFVVGDTNNEGNFGASPAMISIAPHVRWLEQYQPRTVASSDGQAFLTVVARKEDALLIYISPDNRNDDYVFQSDINQWIPIAGTNYVTHSREVGNDIDFLVWSNLRPFVVYDYFSCAQTNNYCATGSIVDVSTSVNPVLTTTTGPVTAAPVTAAPVTPAPVTPAPVTPAPITPAPVTPAPITPAPVTPAPITPAPITPAPVTPAPVTPAPVTPAPATPPPTTPPPSELTGCPCLFINGFHTEDPRYSYLNGYWLLQPDLYNGKPYYKHYGCEYYLYFWDDLAKYWLVGPVLGDNRGVLLNPDIYRDPPIVQDPWRIFGIQNNLWGPSTYITTRCDCSGVPGCSALTFSDAANTFPGTFHFVNMYNGRAVYKNDLTGLYLYYNMEPGACERWVIAAGYGLQSTRAYAYDASFSPIGVSSTWKIRTSSPPTYTWNTDNTAQLYCV